MRNQRLTLAITALGVAVMVAPQAAQAGNKQWATAGKVLTGVAVAHVLTGGGGRHHQSVHISRPYQSVSHSYTHYERAPRRASQCRTPRRYGHQDRSHTRYRSSHRQQAVCHTCRHPRSACECGPVIISIGDSERIYQPRIRGHVAYVQVWESCRRDWRTVRSCDSIW